MLIYRQTTIKTVNLSLIKTHLLSGIKENKRYLSHTFPCMESGTAKILRFCLPAMGAPFLPDLCANSFHRCFSFSLASSISCNRATFFCTFFFLSSCNSFLCCLEDILWLNCDVKIELFYLVVLALAMSFGFFLRSGPLPVAPWVSLTPAGFISMYCKR